LYPIFVIECLVDVSALFCDSITSPKHTTQKALGASSSWPNSRIGFIWPLCRLGGLTGVIAGEVTEPGGLGLLLC
jgi:hypothetical protein